jgi:tRNA(adenine34) deaminase
VLRRKRRLRAAALSNGSISKERDLDSRMMRRAIALAKDAAAMGEVPIGAVVYRGEEIIAEAHNNRETNADPTGHAEMIALRLAGTNLGHWRLIGCSMAVTLEPCPMCAGALVNARVERLVYGADDPKAGAVSTLYEILTDARLNHRLEVKRGIFANECGALLSDFFRERRRINRARLR